MNAVFLTSVDSYVIYETSNMHTLILADMNAAVVLETVLLTHEDDKYLYFRLLLKARSK